MGHRDDAFPQLYKLLRKLEIIYQVTFDVYWQVL